MANTLPHIENAQNTLYLPPKGDFITFIDDAHYAEKVREWGLSTTKEVKTQFWYKEANQQRLVIIKGYEAYGITGEYDTIVIKFQDGHLSCIHPAYLKEMQSPSFSKGISSNLENTKKEITGPVKETKGNEKPVSEKKAPSKQAKDKKEKAPKLVLPEEKVHFTAVVKQFALSWNHFNEENDEVVVLQDVIIEQEEPIEVGLAFCSHSKTLKKFELTPGEIIEFDGKIIKKKLPKGKDVDDEELLIELPVSYKINNPSKIKKN
ncbi:hypothetical protein ACE38V_09615 [Cytobacillus sp. Hz8]|uniref:hypothetical protein n=1 Tax=Cytobacillus sp. Hz8 TaxID=3347168 RepID=UPI0035DA7C48